MGEVEARIARLPLWQGRARIEPLVGGLSNISFVVTDATGKYVVRTGPDYPFHHVLRQREVMTARAAHALGFAPEIVYDEPGLMVSRFIEGKVFAEADMRANIPPIAHFIRRFHENMPSGVTGPAFMFWVFHVIRDYAHTLKAASNRLTARLPRLLAANAELEAAQIALPIRFGHNDLLPANVIDDGRRLWLIDFEYAGFNTAMFDLAGVASNAGFTAEQSSDLLEAYFGAAPSPEVRRSHAAMQCASLLREGLWGLVSELHLRTPGVDYAGYAQINFERFEEALVAFRSKF